MKMTIWTLRMASQIKWAGYETSWWRCLSLAMDECFQQYREDGYSPREAILDDLSYGQ